MIALPVGILIALYVTEFAPRRVRRPIQLALDVLNGLPSIVIGIFIFGLLVIGHQQSALRRRVRARDHHAAARSRARRRRCCALVPEHAARGELRARRQPLADRPRRRSSRASFGGILTGRDARDRARGRRDGAAALHVLDLRRPRSAGTRSSALPSIPLHDLRRLGVTRSRRSRAGVGRGARAHAFVLVISVLAQAALARSRRKLSRR